jgi:uncharacterized protein (DUF1778 family)
MDKDRRVIIRISSEELKVVKAAAKADGRSMAGMIRFAVLSYAQQILGSRSSSKSSKEEIQSEPGEKSD